jgi:hypothetical protein
METGKELPDICANRHGGADTSEIANRMASKEGRARQRNAVLACIASQGDHGATSEEVETKLSMIHQSVAARISELSTMGSIWYGDVRRLTSSGRPARVYHAKD